MSLEPLPASPAILHQFPEHAILIAEIISMWAIVEDGCTDLFVRFTCIDIEQAMLVLSTMSSRTKLEALRSAGDFYLARHHPDLLSEFGSICKTLSNKLNLRNKYAHGLFFVDPEQKLVVIDRSVKRSDPDSSKILHIPNLKIEIQHFVDAVKRLTEFTNQLVKQLPPSR